MNSTNRSSNFLIVILIITLISSCNSERQKENGLFNLKMIEHLSNLCGSEPPHYLCLTQVYLLCANDSIAITHFQDLAIIYSKFEHNNYPTLNSFFQVILNKNFKLKRNSLLFQAMKPNIFQLDSNIHNLYVNIGIKGVKDRFFIQRDADFYLKYNLSIREINTIAYLFFINGYLKIDDDYDGVTQFKELNRILK